MKNYAGYTEIGAGSQGTGRAVYVKNDMVGVVQNALKQPQGNDQLLSFSIGSLPLYT